MIRRSLALASLRCALLSALFAASVPSALAQSAPQPSDEALVAMLSGIEDGPSPGEWARIGPAVVPALARIAADASQPGFVRLRAIQAAGLFATPDSRALLRRALRSRDAMTLREAALAMQRAFGADALADVAPLLSHRDTAVREAAIRALGAIARGQDARAAADAVGQLRRRLAREDDAVLRAEIERQLAARSGGEGEGGGGGDTSVGGGSDPR